EGVDGARVRVGVVALVTVHARGGTGLAHRADQDRVALDRDGLAEAVEGFGVGGLEVRVLAPRGPGTLEDISRAGLARAVVALVAVDAGGVAGLELRTDDDRVSGHAHGGSEAIEGARVGGLEVGVLAPARAAAHEDVGRAGAGSAVVRLVAVDSRRATGLLVRADDRRLARQRHGLAEHVPGIGVRRLEIGLLAPHR